MHERFDRRDAVTMLSAIDEAGIQRGTIGQCVHALVDTIAEKECVMESIALDGSQSERIRHSAILFAVVAAQENSVDHAIGLLDLIAPTIPEEDLLDTILWLKHELRKFGFLELY